MKKFFILFAATCIASAAMADSYVLKDTITVGELQTLFDNEARTQKPEEAEAAQWFEPLEIVSGFNRDVIAEEIDTINNKKTISPIKRGNDTIVVSYFVKKEEWEHPENFDNNTIYKKQLHSYSYITQKAMNDLGKTGETFSAFPDDGRVECISDNFPGLYWQMGDYTKKNALCLRKGITESGKFVFRNVGCYQKLYFLAAAVGSGSGEREMNAVVYYSDGTNKGTSFKFLDHANLLIPIKDTVREGGVAQYDNNGKPKMEVVKYVTTQYKDRAAYHDNFGLPSSDLKSFNYGNKTSYARVCVMDIDQHKLIDSISFISQLTGTDIGLVIFAVTGKTAEVAAPDANPAPHSRAPMRTSNITSESFDVEWDEVSGAASYRLDVATDEDFHHMVGEYNNMTVNGTSAHVEGLDDENDHEYYWRVRSVDASGGQSASSAPRKTVLVGGTAPSTHEEGETIEADLQNLINVAVPSITITRTLYKDGDFNTLCLPFDLSAEALAASPIAGCELYEFVGAKVLGSSQLDIEMRRTNDLVAGVPYLLKWPNTNEVISELVFRNVTITKSKGDTIIGVNDEERTALVRFIGNLDQQYLGNGNKNYLFLGANNTLYWPNTDNNMYGFRAYFDIPSLRSTPAASPVRQGMPARIVLQEQVATGVENTSAKFGGSEKHLENGELVIIRDNIRYNVMGLQLR